MSGKLVGRIYEFKLSRAEQAVLVAMADHANEDGGDVFPSVPFIAWKTDYSERQVQRVMAGLRERGALVVVREATRYKPVEYRIDTAVLTPKPPFRGDILSSESGRGDTAMAGRGDTAMSPEPPVNHQEPTSKATQSVKTPSLVLTKGGGPNDAPDGETEPESAPAPLLPDPLTPGWRIPGWITAEPGPANDVDELFPPSTRPNAPAAGAASPRTGRRPANATRTAAQPQNAPNRPTDPLEGADPDLGIKTIIGHVSLTGPAKVEQEAAAFFMRELGKYRGVRRAEAERFGRLAGELAAVGWSIDRIKEAFLNWIRIETDERRGQYITPENATASFNAHLLARASQKDAPAAPVFTF